MSKVPTWIVEPDVFPTDTQPLLDALKQRSIPYCELRNRYDMSTMEQQIDFGDCAIFYGSLPVAKLLHRQATWIPGVIYDYPKYECRKYYAHFSKYLLNDNYAFMPFGDMCRRRDWLYKVFGADRAIFVRPDRGDKPFTGQLVYAENFAKDSERLGFGFSAAVDELIVVAEPRNIAFEWRFVVVEGKVVAGSQYKKDERSSISGDYPQTAFDFATHMASLYNPDIAWVVDVCKTKATDEYRLLEIGCFSCAGLYECDRLAVVDAVSAAAVREWESYQ